MPKRKTKDKVSYYEAKLKLLKEKSNAKRRRVITYSSSSDSENKEDGTTQDDATAINFENPVQMQDINDEEALLPPLSEPEPEPKLDEVPELNPDLLLALGDATDEQPMYGENIHQSLVQRFVPILKKGLANEVKEKLLKDYSVPDNCKYLKAPTLNPEIAAALSEVTRNRDKNIQVKQDQLGLGISAVSRAITLLLLSDDKLQAIKILTDGCRILGNVHFTETDIRRKLISPCLEKSIMSMTKDQERDETLFGSALPEKIKASKAIEKQGQQIKKPVFLQRASSLPVAFNSPTPSTSRTRFQGNATGSPRYPSASRGGRGGPARAARPYRRPAQAYAQPRPASSYTQQQRAAHRQ